MLTLGSCFGPRRPRATPPTAPRQTSGRAAAALAAAAMSDVPEDLKAIAPYLKRAEELDERDPVMAYYCTPQGVTHPRGPA